MIIVKDDSYLISEKINVGQFFGRQPEDGFVTLREPDTKTTMKFQAASKKEDPEESINAFCQAFPNLLVDHSLMKSESEKLSGAEVLDVVLNKLELFMHVFTEYSSRVLFSLGKERGGK